MGIAGGDAERPDVWPMMVKNASLVAVFFAMEQSRHPGADGTSSWQTSCDGWARVSCEW